MLAWLSGSLFLGWALGANDASNVFGTAVGTRAVRFATAAICICIFCILGAAIQGSTGIESISCIAAQNVRTAFIISFSAALVVAFMTVVRLPVSASQAVVGAIIGVGYAAGQRVDFSGLARLAVCWIGTPLGAMMISSIAYIVVGRIWNRFSQGRIELMDRLLRYGLIAAGSYGAYALGANNVANVVGVFAGIEGFELSSRAWALVGAGSICLGVITFGRRVMTTVGENLVPLQPFSAFIVVVAEAITVHIFAIVGAPVSTSQAVVGAVLGIGLVKGMQSVNTRVLVGIGIGWISTPLLAAIVSYTLYAWVF